MDVGPFVPGSTITKFVEVRLYCLRLLAGMCLPGHPSFHAAVLKIFWTPHDAVSCNGLSVFVVDVRDIVNGAVDGRGVVNHGANSENQRKIQVRTAM